MMRKCWVILLMVILCLGGLPVEAQDSVLISAAPCWYGETYSVDCTYAVSGGNITAVNNLLDGGYFFDWNYIPEEGILIVAAASANPFPAPEQIRAFISVTADAGTTLNLQSLRINGKKAGTGQIVSGTVTSFGKESDEITIRLMQNDMVKYSVSVVGNTASYRLTNVNRGEYILQISKSGHITEKYSITVADDDIEQNAEMWLYGDVNKDGEVSEADVNLMKKYFAGYAVTIDPKTADVNADNRLTRQDAMILARHAANWKGYVLPYSEVQ